MIIDVHAHIAPKHLIEKGGYGLERRGEGYVIHAERYNVPVEEEMFSPELQIEAMMRQGVDMRVVCNAPFLMGIEKNGPDAAGWARDCNTFIADCCARYPDRFSGFCTLPLEDVDAALEELRFSKESLGLCGVELPTHFRGENLDEERFAPLWEELNRLAMPVLIHPTQVRMAEPLKIGYLSNLMGNPFETTITAGRMLVSGFFDKYPKVRVQLSHGGGTLPYLLGRIGHRHKALRDDEGKLLLPDGLYFDTVVFEPAILAFLAARCDNVVLGTDAPFDMAEFDPVGLIKSAVSAERGEEIMRSTPVRYLGLQEL